MSAQASKAATNLGETIAHKMAHGGISVDAIAELIQSYSAAYQSRIPRRRDALEWHPYSRVRSNAETSNGVAT